MNRSHDVICFAIQDDMSECASNPRYGNTTLFMFDLCSVLHSTICMQSWCIYHKVPLSKSYCDSIHASNHLILAGPMSAAAIVFLHVLLFCIAIHNAL